MFKVKLALNIDAELNMIVKQHCCLHNINMSDYMSELIAEHFHLRLNPDYSLNMDSAKELRMKQIDESINRLEAEKAQLHKELYGDIKI